MTEMKRNKKNRQGRALASQKKKAYRGVLVGVALGLGFVVLAVFTPRIFSVKQMVMAQVVRGKSVDAPARLPKAPGSDRIPAHDPIAPVAGPARTTNGAPTSADTPNGRNVYEAVGFDRLSAFDFEVTEEMANGTADLTATSLDIAGQIPPAVKALNKKLVTVRGFVLPLDVRHGLMTRFLILKSQTMCCYGIAPKMNEWITVRLSSKGVKAVMDRPVNVSGTLYVGESREGASLVAIYRMEADKFDAP
ncbi:MAG: hypothetical protein JWR69_4475 [Pedosphaera sp.]|nr:hypothetical protein [Pedosphaera sp.]